MRVSKVLSKVLDGVDATVGTVADYTVKPAMKPLVKQAKKGLLVDNLKDGKPVKSWDNLWSGKQVNPLFSYGVVGAIGLMQMGDYQKQKVMRPIKTAKSTIVEEGHADILSYDGSGQMDVPKNLNAHGDIVFGLHNSRRG